MKIIRPMPISDASLLSSNAGDEGIVVYATGSSYARGIRVMIDTPDTHVVYESLQDGNVGHDPALLSSALWWSKVGRTNRWKMFDASVTSQTICADQLSVTLATTGRINALALINISASVLHITMTDAVEGVVYEKTLALIDHSGVNDWYSWFFEPAEKIGDLTLFDLPPYLSATITITLSDPGNTVRCGWLVLGMEKFLGESTWGMQLAIDDYSEKLPDLWGNVEVVERDYSREGKFVLRVAREKFDALAKFLPTVRTQTLVWVGSERYASTIIVGFFESFNLEIEGFATHLCSLTIKGLI